MTDKKKKNRPPFDEAMFNELYSCFRAAGVNPTVQQMDALRGATFRLSKLIEVENKMTAIALFERLQTKISKSFEDLEKLTNDLINENKDRSKKVEIPEKITDN